MRLTLAALLAILLLAQAVPAAAQSYRTEAAVQTPAVTDDDPNGKPEAFGARRGGFRSPRMGYTGGNRARNPAVNNPAGRAPAAPAARRGGFLGGMFGGFLAGSLLGSLFNPFGFGGTGGVSLIGLLFWGVILFLAYRLLRRIFNKGR